jgi:hypothetical protein
LPLFFFTHALMTAFEGRRAFGCAASATPAARASGSATSKTRLRGRRMWISSRSIAPTDTGGQDARPLPVRLSARLCSKAV